MKQKININVKFSLLLLLGETFFGGIIILNRGILIDSYFVNDYHNTSMDYFNMLANIEGLDPYAQNANYPAMCFLIWRILYHIVPYTPKNQDGFFLRSYMPAQLGYIVFTLLCIVIIWELLKYKLQNSDFEKTILPLSLLLSGPFIFAMERGNIIILSLVFLLAFIQFYDSEKYYLRILSYVALAMAASIKIYPALFGIIILRKKRYKEAIIAIILGITFFLFPFFAFDGFESLLKMLNGMLMASDLQGNIGMGYNFCFSNLIRILATFFGFTLNSISIWVKIIPALLCICIYVFNTEEWKKLFAITLFCIWIPEFSYTYTLIFFFIPLISYFKEETIPQNYFSYIYRILYFIIFVPMALPILPQLDIVHAKFPINVPTIIINAAIFIMGFLLLFSGLYNFIHKKYLPPKNMYEELK